MKSKIRPLRPRRREPLPPRSELYLPPSCWCIAERVGTNETTYSPPMSYVEAHASLLARGRLYEQTCELRWCGDAFVAEQYSPKGAVLQFVASAALVEAESVRSSA